MRLGASPKKIRSVIYACALLLGGAICVVGGARIRKALPRPGFSAARIAAHVKFLASDLLEGRGTGPARWRHCGRIYRHTVRLDGLQPAGDNGTYYPERSHGRGENAAEHVV